MLFSCKMPAGALGLLCEWLAPSKSSRDLPLPDDANGAMAVVEGSAGAVNLPSTTEALVSGAAARDIVFFRVVSCGLSRAHLASPVDFQSSDVGMLLLKNRGPGDVGDSFRVQTSGMNLDSTVARPNLVESFPLVPSLSSLTVDQMRSFKAWKESTSGVMWTEMQARLMCWLFSLLPFYVREISWPLLIAPCLSLWRCRVPMAGNVPSREVLPFGQGCGKTHELKQFRLQGQTCRFELLAMLSLNFLGWLLTVYVQLPSIHFSSEHLELWVACDFSIFVVTKCRLVVVFCH